MFNISKSKITTKDGKTRLSAFFCSEQVNAEVFYETDEKYGQYFVTEVSDPFIIAAILPALIEGKDIHVECVGDYLYHHFKTLAYLLGKVFNYPPIKLNANSVIHTNFYPHAVASGFSGGVDSFATYINHSASDCPDSLKLNCLTLFNVRAYGNDYEQTRKWFKNDVVRASAFAEEIKLPLVTLDSNLSSIYKHKTIYHYSLRLTLCNISAVLTMQKLFRTYFFSSGSTIDYVRFSPYDQQYYEGLLVQLLSNNNTEIFIAEHNLNRVEKTLSIVDYEFVQRHLYVCAAPLMNEKHGCKYKNDTSPNCCECPKCVRTLLAIDSDGKLDLYAQRFDIDKWRRIRDREIALMYSYRDENHFAQENWDLFVQRGHSLSPEQKKIIKQISSDRYPSYYRKLRRFVRNILVHIGLKK